MHYIRFLKSPRVLPSSPPTLTAKVTVTTDLGESFLLADISLIAELEFEDGSIVAGSGNRREFKWKGKNGMRSLEIVVSVPASKGKRKIGREKVRMLLRPKDEQHAVDGFGAIFGSQSKRGVLEGVGGILAVRSMAIDVGPAGVREEVAGVGMAERVFSTSVANKVRIWEETGESIARHIWDAGLVLSSYLTSLLISPRAAKALPRLPILEQVLKSKDLHILELGAGCGIVGISLATSLRHTPVVLLTDLPEASEILEQNLSPSVLKKSTSSKLSHQVLDWASPLPPNVRDAKWDLVIVADCTYNPDVVPDLVRTLGSIADGDSQVVVLLAMKVRHDSEMVFFSLMQDCGFDIKEKCEFPLPVLGGEEQEIEVFVFQIKS